MMKWPKEVLIFRHGQSARNVQKAAAKDAGIKADYSDGVRDQDTPLTDKGSLQCEYLGRGLSSEYPPFPSNPADPNPIDVMLVSPYLRTRQSAERFCFGLGYQPKIVIEERIREIEFGILDGLTPAGVEAKYPEEVKRKQREGKYWYRAPGGESRPDVRLRCHSLLGTITREYRGKVVGVWCHSVVVLALRSLLERWGEDQYMIVDKENDVENASLTRYTFNYKRDRLELECYNKILYPKEMAWQSGK